MSYCKKCVHEDDVIFAEVRPEVRSTRYNEATNTVLAARFATPEPTIAEEQTPSTVVHRGSEKRYWENPGNQTSDTRLADEPPLLPSWEHHWDYESELVLEQDGTFVRPEELVETLPSYDDVLNETDWIDYGDEEYADKAFSEDIVGAATKVAAEYYLHFRRVVSITMESLVDWAGKYLGNGESVYQVIQAERRRLVVWMNVLSARISHARIYENLLITAMRMEELGIARPVDVPQMVQKLREIHRISWVGLYPDNTRYLRSERIRALARVLEFERVWLNSQMPFNGEI